MFLERSAVNGFDASAFLGQSHFPWMSFTGFLQPQAFAELNRTFPGLDAFERHEGLRRSHGQRSHDRFYLAFEESIYHRQGKGDYALQSDRGTISSQDLAPPWQAFLQDLRGQPYQSMIRQALGRDDLTMRLAWHLGVSGSEVSPHRDALDKVGTHIFYFNTAEDWDPTWGGSILALGGKKVAAMNPDFEDFESEAGTDIRDNRSFLFKNTEAAWHGVRRLTCPPGHYRRLFNVIFEAPPVRRRSWLPAWLR